MFLIGFRTPSLFSDSMDGLGKGPQSFKGSCSAGLWSCFLILSPPPSPHCISLSFFVLFSLGLWPQCFFSLLPAYLSLNSLLLSKN